MRCIVRVAPTSRSARSKSLGVILFLYLSTHQSAIAAINVIVAPSGSFQAQLNSMTTPLGFTFTFAESQQIHSNIVSYLESAYSNFDINFYNQTFPPGNHHRIDTSATTSIGGLLGEAPIDFRNVIDNEIQKVYTHNFGNIIEQFESRSTQIFELGRALGLTAAHELGHSLGLRHHHAYGYPSIGPWNYANTGGLQNFSIMATFTTGQTETDRERLNTFNQFSNLVLEAATGITANPLPMELELGDAGNTAGSAQNLSVTYKPISGLGGGLVKGTLFNESDVDFYSFSTRAENALVSAEVWSDLLNISSDSFDASVTLYDSNGTTILSTVHDTRFENNTFGSGPIQARDPFMLNIPLPSPGTYYLKVSSTGNIRGNPGGNYNLILGVTVPETPPILYCLTAAFALLSWRSLRHRRSL